MPDSLNKLRPTKTTVVQTLQSSWASNVWRVCDDLSANLTATGGIGFNKAKRDSKGS